MVAPDLDRFVSDYHEALNEFFRGDSEPAKALYSHSEDANPFGPVAIGWEKVEEAIDRAASNYRDGRATGFETLATYATQELRISSRSSTSKRRLATKRGRLQ